MSSAEVDQQPQNPNVKQQPFLEQANAFFKHFANWASFSSKPKKMNQAIAMKNAPSRA